MGSYLVPQVVLVPVAGVVGGAVVEPAVTVLFDIRPTCLEPLSSTIEHDDEIEPNANIDDPVVVREVRVPLPVYRPAQLNELVELYAALRRQVSHRATMAMCEKIGYAQALVGNPLLQ